MTHATPTTPTGKYATEETTERAGTRRLFRLAGALLLLALPAVVLRDAVPAAAALHTLAGPDTPWIPAAAVGLVLFAAPLAVAGALVLVMMPGLLLALALDRAPTVASWVLDGFVLSLLLVSGGAALVQAVAGTRLTGGGFGGATINLVRADQVEPYRTFLQKRFQERMGYAPQTEICRIVDGAGPTTEFG